MTTHTPINLTDGWHIEVSTEPSGVLARAVEELSAHLTMIAAPAPKGTGLQISLGIDHDASGDTSNDTADGFDWTVSNQQVQLRGQSARGLLYAVYSFLVSLGFGWPGHKPDETNIPSGTQFQVPQDMTERPSFAGRCLIIGHHAFLAEHEAWIVWAARNRLNTIFVHTAEEGLALGAAPAHQWHSVSAAVRETCKQFGMVLEVGGHGLSRLLPRALFKDMPDAFRMKDGKRTPDHNLDPLNEAGMAIVRENALAWFKQNEGADIYHLWPDDIPGGGWSHSPECRNLSASDQALIATNALATELTKVDPDAEISHIAYHDTEPAPQAAKPDANVSLLWAPRMRSYAHDAFDETSTVNQRYPSELHANVQLFTKARARPTRVFEYYLDTILFKSVLPPLVEIMARDAVGYRDVGTHTLQALMVGGRPWNAPQLNAYAFARLTWDATLAPQTIVRDFAQLLVGEDAADLLVAHYDALSTAFSQALMFEPHEAKPAAAAGGADFLDTPPTDMGDPWHATPEDVVQRLTLRSAISAQLATARQALAAAVEKANSAKSNGKSHLMGLKAEFDLTCLWFDFHFARLALYDAWHKRDADNTAPIEAALTDAYAACDAADAWAATHVEEPCYQQNTQLLHWLFWRLRLDWIREQISPPGPQRDAIRRERKADMAARFAAGRTLWTDNQNTSNNSEIT